MSDLTLYRNPELSRLHMELQKKETELVILQEENTKLRSMLKKELREQGIVSAKQKLSFWQRFKCWWGWHNIKIEIDHEGLKKPHYVIKHGSEVRQIKVDNQAFGHRCKFYCSRCFFVLKDYDSASHSSLSFETNLTLSGLISAHFSQFEEQRLPPGFIPGPGPVEFPFVQASLVSGTNSGGPK